MTSEKLKELLCLVAHPSEGGYYAETYRADESIERQALPSRYNSARCTGTAIYYLLEPTTFSAMHCLASDEIFHFYRGDPVEMLQLWPDGSARVIVIGNDIERGMHPQVVVPRGVWQGSRLAAGGSFALLGCTVSPGFEFADYEAGNRDALCGQYPAVQNMITALTR
jgi:uncharacterized protein